MNQGHHTWPSQPLAMACLQLQLRPCTLSSTCWHQSKCILGVATWLAYRPRAQGDMYAGMGVNQAVAVVTTDRVLPKPAPPQVHTAKQPALPYCTC